MEAIPLIETVKLIDKGIIFSNDRGVSYAKGINVCMHLI